MSGHTENPINWRMFFLILGICLVSGLAVGVALIVAPLAELAVMVIVQRIKNAH